jgi:hypothetical protein
VLNHEQFVNRLEARLGKLNPDKSIEGLKGGYSFCNYVGVLGKTLPLDPAVLVLAVFDENDIRFIVV